MTLSETIELIEKAMEGVTPGPWTYRVDDSQGGVAYAATILGPNIEERGHPVVADIPPRTMHGTHGANAAYIAACSPDRMGVVLAAASEAEALKREIAELRDSLSDVLELAERQWANPEELSEIRRARALLSKESAEQDGSASPSSGTPRTWGEWEREKQNEDGQ